MFRQIDDGHFHACAEFANLPSNGEFQSIFGGAACGVWVLVAGFVIPGGTGVRAGGWGAGHGDSPVSTGRECQSNEGNSHQGLFKGFISCQEKPVDPGRVCPSIPVPAFRRLLTMAADIIDGKAFAAGLRERIAGDVEKLATKGLVPGLAVVLVGEDPASQVYVGSKERMAREAGMVSTAHRLPADTPQTDLIALIETLNADPTIHGILVQLPLPSGLDPQAVVMAIDPAKDVDGLHPVNAGNLISGAPALVPCTPSGCMMLLRDRLGDLSGLNAVVVGRSNLMGKPMAVLLLAANCTVTVAHSRTRDLATVCRSADILVAAVGRPRMIGGDWIKPGATVIDVGINRLPPEPSQEKGKLVGDVDFDAAKEVAGAITPVPGGVGPMTIACLLDNTVEAACRATGIARG